METELNNTAMVVGNYNNIPTSVTSQVLVVTMINGLTIVKEADKNVWADGILTYTIKVGNQTTETYSKPVVTDILDGNLINFINDSVKIDGTKTSNYTFNNDTNTLTVELDDIEPQGSKTITFQVSKKSP